jgi:hypothetical protein
MEIFLDQVWQMSVGERAAFEGMLSQISPKLSIEIGTAEGASLKRIAAHSGEVHSFDLIEPSLDVPENVTLHTGDSHKQLPELLAKLAAEGRNVDFVLVDGDHSAAGVKQDLEDLLDSDAIGRTHIVIHDINNEEVRRGVDAVRYRNWRKVASVELDCVPGYMFKEERLEHELWGGLGLVVVDDSRPAHQVPDPMQQRYYPAAPLFAEIRDIVVAREEGRDVRRREEHELLREQVAELQEEVERLGGEVRHERAGRDQLERSISWRLTRPLRSAKGRARQLLS